MWQISFLDTGTVISSVRKIQRQLRCTLRALHKMSELEGTARITENRLRTFRCIRFKSYWYRNTASSRKHTGEKVSTFLDERSFLEMHIDTKSRIDIIAIFLLCIDIFIRYIGIC